MKDMRNKIHLSFIDAYWNPEVLMRGRSIAIILFSITLFSCNSTSEPDLLPVLQGQVLDQQGEPVSGAMIEVEYFLDTDTGYMPKRQRSEINLLIRFSVAQAGPVRVWITGLESEDTLRVLMEDFVNAGNYTVIWDGTDQDGYGVINQFYRSHVATDGIVGTDTVFINRDYYDYVGSDLLTFYTLSDADGEFTISQEKLAVMKDIGIQLVDELGNSLDTVKLSREVRIWALHHAHGLAVSKKKTFRAEGPTNVQLRF